MSDEGELKFMQSVNWAAERLLREAGPKSKNVSVKEADILLAARDGGLTISRTGSIFCYPVAKAIVAAAYERENPLAVFIAVRHAWLHVNAPAAEKSAA